MFKTIKVNKEIGGRREDIYDTRCGSSVLFFDGFMMEETAKTFTWAQYNLRLQVNRDYVISIAAHTPEGNAENMKFSMAVVSPNGEYVVTYSDCSQAAALAENIEKETGLDMGDIPHNLSPAAAANMVRKLRSFFAS